MRKNNVIIEEKAPFANCKLGRKPYADVLTSIVSTYKDGFVLAVNGKWGSGKTTFMKMWEQDLKNSDYKTIYLNAWKNDFTSDPVVAIMGEIRSLTTNDNAEKFQSIVDKVIKVGSAAIPSLVKTAATLVGLGPAAEAIEKLSEAAVKAFNDEIKDYDEKKKCLDALKLELSEFVKLNCNDKPLIFIVDELDRCRPDYAVEVLEKIKHFFSVDGIVFVLSIDKDQLGYAVQGHYGSSDIDSDEYLRRFIDVEYTLPKPKYDDFCNYLYERYGFAEFFEQSVRQGHPELKIEREEFLEIIAIYCSKKELSLRQLEKIFIHARIVLRMFNNNNYVHPQIVFLLILLKEYNKSLYQALSDVDNDIQNIATKLEDEFGEYITEKDARRREHSFEYVFVLLMMFYKEALAYRVSNTIRLIDSDDNGIERLTFRLTKIDEKQVMHLFSGYYSQKNDLSIIYYTNKIDLLQPLI